ncbi:MAG: sulfotransferase domain-containing protein [Thermoanaerobaculia bacterium]
MLPNCIILGAQKAASTFLHRCLGDHPEVFTPKGEVHFFEDPDYAEGNIGQLEKLLEPGAGRKILAIKRPRYLAAPECPPRIAKHCPRAVLLVVLRDPVERALSAYFHYVGHGFLPAVDAERGLSAILEGRWKTRYPASEEILEFGFYHRHLSRYWDYFPADRIHVTFTDDLREDGAGTVRKVYEFLGIRPDYSAGALRSRPQGVVYSLPRLRFRRLRNRIVYRYDENRVRAYPRRANLPGRMLNQAVLSVDARLLRPVFGNARPQLSDSLRAKLRSVYHEDVCALEATLGRSLTAWKEPV